MVFLPGCSQPEESVGKCNIRVRRRTGEICEDLLRIGGHVAGPGWPLVPPGEDRKRRGLRESEFLASPRTCPQSAARDCNDRAEKTTDSAATISGSNVHPLHALASPNTASAQSEGTGRAFSAEEERGQEGHALQERWPGDPDFFAPKACGTRTLSVASQVDPGHSASGACFHRK